MRVSHFVKLEAVFVEGKVSCTPLGVFGAEVLLPAEDNDPGRTRTCNPRLRRPMPYPLGHRAFCFIIILKEDESPVEVGSSPYKWHKP